MQHPAHSLLSTPSPGGPGEVTLAGRFMLPDLSEHPCRVAAVTPKGATFITQVEVPPGTPVVTYVEELGRLEGRTGATLNGRMAVAFEITLPRRDRLEARLTWLAGRVNHAQGRRHPRFEPTDGTTQLTLPDGTQLSCEIIDISVSGAAIRTGQRPGLGSLVLLGKTRGRVVRQFEGGIAIEFVKQLDQKQLRKTID